MKKLLLLPVLFLLCCLNALSQQKNIPINWPDSVYSGKQGAFHMQGVAVDKANGFIYFSFTDRLVKTDLAGKLIGSVTGFIGHLGDLDVNERDGKIYGSLEYKNDAIGKGIKKELKLADDNQTGFYIAIFDGARVTRPNMNAETDSLLRTVYLPEVVKDYEANVHTDGKLLPHRFACSGIDGVAFGPSVGGQSGDKRYLYVAYGIYGDTTRTDNDHQVILKYDVTGWDKYAQNLTQNNLHHSGPKRPLEKYFLRTGATNYGIQNLAYDAATGNLFAAVYRGAKSQYPNYDLFVIDMHQQPLKDALICDNRQITIKTLSLLPAGEGAAKSSMRGWHFKWGATGLCPLGGGLFYISHNRKLKDGSQESTLIKYKWIGDEKTAFTAVK